MRVVLYVLLIIPNIAFSQDSWELKKDKHGIEIYMREVSGSPFKEIMVRMKSRSTLEKFKKIILDVDSHRKWIYSNNELRLVKRINNNEFIYYTEIDLPWPVSNRDVDTHLRVIPDSIPNTVFVKSHSVKGFTPHKEGIVRVESTEAFWEVIKSDNDEISIEYFQKTDPAGSLPPWLVNLVATKGHFTAFSTLKEMLEED